MQAAQSKKGKAAEKSPAEETAKIITTAACDDAADIKLVKEQIDAQGQKVREMKAAGASKVIYCQAYIGQLTFGLRHSVVKLLCVQHSPDLA